MAFSQITHQYNTQVKKISVQINYDLCDTLLKIFSIIIFHFLSIICFVLIPHFFDNLSKGSNSFSTNKGF